MRLIDADALSELLKKEAEHHEADGLLERSYGVLDAYMDVLQAPTVQLVPDDRWPEVEEYCDNDVKATEAASREVQEKIEQYEETIKLKALIIEQQKEIIKLQEQRAKLLQLQCDVLENELGFKEEKNDRGNSAN